MKRKVIQIAVDPNKGNIIALASDGSIWVKTDEWHRIKDIPPKVGEERELDLGVDPNCLEPMNPKCACFACETVRAMDAR